MLSATVSIFGVLGVRIVFPPQSRARPPVEIALPPNYVALFGLWNIP